MAWGSWFPKSYLQQTVGVTRVDLVSFKGQKHTSGEHNRGVSYSGISELHRYGGFREPTNRSAGTAQILLPLLFFPCLFGQETYPDPLGGPATGQSFVRGAPADGLCRGSWFPKSYLQQTVGVT